MALPRIAVIVPLLLAGLFVPAIGAESETPPSGTLGMEHEHFRQDEITVDCGSTLTMQNDSRWVHVVGPGQDGLLVPDETSPVTGRHLLETGDVLTTGPWTSPGVHYLTCPVHPEMNVKVIVRECAGTHCC
jgi:plastocyanin